MGSAGARLVGGVRRQVGDNKVREWLGISTVESELRARRLKWWKGIVRSPEENRQLLAALFGRMDRELQEGMEVGIPPWVRQLVGDLAVLAEREFGAHAFSREVFEQKGRGDGGHASFGARVEVVGQGL